MKNEYLLNIIVFKITSSLHELSEDVVKDTAVLEVCEFGLRVDAHLHLELLAAVGCDIEGLSHLELAAIGRDVEGLLASEAE